ncbi:MAG: hypothetical protein KF788_00570 [Piscinibacter sp.]|nr:hypothetical protein [Piscinibacter sp.]
MKTLHRALAALSLGIGALLTSGCTTTLVVMHVYDKMTEGDPTSCFKLNSVDRALQERCGRFVAGSLQAKDIQASGLPICPLTVATRNPTFWPVLPELIAKGATPEACSVPPWVALAQAHPCPDFSRATPAELQALRWVAEADARAIHHDAVRALSCPNARTAGLDRVLDGWVANDQMPAGVLPFGALGALHPSHLGSPLARALEARGHTAAAALGGYDGKLPGGFEEALRTGDFAALDWWLQRAPSLANRAPPANNSQLPWVPLARVLTPAFMPDADLQRRTVTYLIAHGADPDRALPHDPSQSVRMLAVRMKSPLLASLAASPGTAAAPNAGAPIAAVAAPAAALRGR